MRFDDKFNVIKIYANCFEICFVKLFQEILFCKYISTRNTIHYNNIIYRIYQSFYTRIIHVLCLEISLQKKIYL